MRAALTLVMMLTLWHAAPAAAFTLEVSEPELQEKIAAAMPVEVTKWMVTVSFTNPRVSLGQGSSVSILSDMRVAVPGGLARTGSAEIQGTPTYIPASGAFFLKEPNITDIRVTGLPDAYLPNARRIAQFLATQVFAVHPVYVLKSDTLKGKIAKSLLKSVSVMDRKLILTFEILSSDPPHDVPPEQVGG